MRVLFMGTPEIAVASLEALCKHHEIVAVFCQPDKPVGRKMVLTAPPVKQKAQQLGLTVFQPKTLRNDEAKETIQNLNPDIIAVVAYGKILPKEILDIPKHGCINAHASILPKYRGASPIQQALLNGDDETGVSMMRMDEGMDTGDVMLVEKLKIETSDDAQTLFEKLSFVAASSFVKAFELIENGEAKFVKQQGEATSAPIIKKDDGAFSFEDDAKEIVQKVKAFVGWPSAYFKTFDTVIKVHKAAFVEASGNPGEVLSTKPLVIAAKNGAVELLELSPQSKGKMSGAAFAVGKRLKACDII